MEAHVAGQSLVPPRRSTDTSRPSEIDQHKLEMERLGQVCTVFMQQHLHAGTPIAVLQVASMFSLRSDDACLTMS